MKFNFTLPFLFLLFVHAGNAYAQCALTPLTLKERTDKAELIVEARVESKRCYWNAGRTMIHTAQVLAVSRIYKGAGLLDGTTLELITAGGVVENDAVRVDPELETETGEIGIFLLVSRNGEWISESGPQGFIRIDKHTAEATDVFHVYPPFTIQNRITELTGLPVKDINSQLTGIRVSAKRAAPVISSISPKVITSGTSSVLTIKGSNFKSLIDTSSVQFRNGDDGGATYVKALKRDYISWSDTMVRLQVRTKAGTGRIRIVVGGNGIASSTDTLKISYAHLNVVSGDTIGYETQQIGMNGNNGITWKMNRRFYDSAGARGAFIRSLERWRCGTYINWDTLGRLSHSAIKADGVNMCAWDTASNMPSGVLAQCFSYWSGCFTPGLKWYVNELDIRFRVKPTGSTNWNYTTGNATSNQFHFESVATHELGHGHQLGHVINSPLVMHFSIANGQTKPGLNQSDIDAGNYVMGKSGTSVCGRNAHSKLNSGNCAIVAPNANFTLSKNQICKNETFTVTDSSSGNISAYAWNFGSNASPATASTKGPHTVSYSAGGSKTISLTITTLTGNTVKNKVINVQNDSKMIPDFTYSAAEKGKVTFTNVSNNATSASWDFGDSDTSSAISPQHNYSAGGTYQVRLTATNTCNTEDTVKTVKFSFMDFGANKSSVCLNEPVIFSDSGDANASGWQWTFSGGNPSSANGKGPHTVTYGSSGSKSASLTVTVTGSANQTYTRNAMISVSADTFTQAAFRYGYYGKNIVGFENLSTGSGMSYKWYFGDGDSSSQKDPLHTYANVTPKQVRLVVSGNCGTDDTTVMLPDLTSLRPASNGPGISFYPNPANNTLTISNADGKVTVHYVITDIHGRQVLSGSTSGTSPIQVQGLSAGTYLLRVQSESGISSTFIWVKE